MKLSKYNYYLQHDKNVFVFNTLSEKITSIPISAISHDHQTIEMASEEVLSTLQELGMVYEDDVDENRVYNFWVKRYAHDESCFKANIYLDNEKYNTSNLFEMTHHEEFGADNKKKAITEQIVSLSSMLASYSLEINLINSEKADFKFINDAYSFLSRYKEQFAQMRVNLIYNTSYIEKYTLELLQKIGIDNVFLEVLDEVMAKKIKGLPVTVLKSVFTTDNTSPEIDIIVGPDHFGAYNELSRIPMEFRDKIKVHFYTYPQIYMDYECFLMDLHKNLERFYSTIISIVQLGYKINPIEMVQSPCFEIKDSCISLLPNKDIRKCNFCSTRMVKAEDGVDSTSQLYQYILSNRVGIGKRKECVDCMFAPWCSCRCLVKCVHSSTSVNTCQKDIYEKMAKIIINIWRQMEDETT